MQFNNFVRSFYIFFIQGDKEGRASLNNPLCRQGLSVPKEPSLYSCAEPILGKYVFVIEKGEATLALCEVEVYVNGKYFYTLSFETVANE